MAKENVVIDYSQPASYGAMRCAIRVSRLESGAVVVAEIYCPGMSATYGPILAIEGHGVDLEFQARTIAGDSVMRLQAFRVKEDDEESGAETVHQAESGSGGVPDEP